MLKLLTVKRAKLTLHFGSSNLLQHNSASPPRPPPHTSDHAHGPGPSGTAQGFPGASIRSNESDV